MRLDVRNGSECEECFDEYNCSISCARTAVKGLLSRIPQPLAERFDTRPGMWYSLYAYTIAYIADNSNAVPTERRR